MADGVVVSVSSEARHDIRKGVRESVFVREGHGVDGDAHAGATIQHVARVKKNPTKLNLRQVHLIAIELHLELAAAGIEVSPGAMGENLTTSGIDLLALPTGTLLDIGEGARLEITGLRNPCKKLDDVAPGLMDAVLDRGPDGELIRRAGVMAIVIDSGWIRVGDLIRVQLPLPPHRALRPV
jgi:MOSC domain-containing protein YiiM